jgi:YVTN family beta-propeller protein
MRFGILGSLEVIEDGRSLALGGPKQRALLAMLLLHANEAVSRDRLIDGLWGERPPAMPAHTLDTYLSRLRKLLGPDRIERNAGGYVLRVEPDELDLDRFNRLAAQGVFEDALAVWRGPALADLLFEPFVAGEAEQLEERRRNVLEERIDADLARGGGADLVGELERLVREHPLRERLLGQLMRALYRAGRQAAALEVYRSAKRRLAEELGLEPGPQLHMLERQILAHDPSLGAPGPVSPGPESSAAGSSARARSSHRRLRFGVAAAVGVIAAFGIGSLLETGGTHSATGASARVSRLLAVAPGSGRLMLANGLPGSPSGIAEASGSLWLSDPNGQVVLKVDASSGTVVDRIPVGGQPGSIVTGDGSIWVASTTGHDVARIDPGTDAITQTVNLGGGNISAIAFGQGSLWVADSTDQALVEIDAESGSPTRTFALDTRPTALVVGRRAIWVVSHDARSVSEVDLASGQTLATIAVGNGPVALALGDGVLWVANSLDSTVSAIDTETSQVVATIPVGSGPSALALVDGAVWVASQYSGAVSRIDPRTKVVTKTVHVGGEPVALLAAAGSVWVGAGPTSAAHRGGTLRLVTTRPFDTIDPAFQFVTSLQFSRFAYDTLVTLAAAPGPEGLRLVPDLAVSVPVPTGGGTTYTFRLRAGIRYSNRRLLRAGDFRRAIERQYRVGGPVTDYFRGIVGARTCSRARCDLSRGIVTSDSTGTVSIHLISPDPDFLYKLSVQGFSAPIPAGTPNRDVGAHPVPGTGPYRIAESNSRQVRFVRNPYFREWSHEAQPEGNPDVIVWRFPPTLAAATRQVTQGHADWVANLAASQLPRLQVLAASRLHVNPDVSVEFLTLNTHRAPFDDVRVRQALNYAIDRGRIARMYGGRQIATPICQPILPGLPGFRRYCPYTQNPHTSGVWSAPDITKARRLVAASGTRGTRITVWGSTKSGFIPRGLAAYVASVLRTLGYKTTVRLAPLGSIPPSTWRNMQVNAAGGDWVPDYPSPSSYLPGFFGCQGSLGNGDVCDPHLDDRMDAASLLQISHPAGAAALWARIDRELVDRAYWVPTVSLGTAELVSTRLRNYQSSPVGDFIADQAWVK